MFYVETRLNEFAEIMRLGGDVCVVDKNSNKNITVYANVKNNEEVILFDDDMHFVNKSNVIVRFQTGLSDHCLCKFYKKDGTIVFGRVRQDSKDDSYVTSVPLYNSFDFTIDKTTGNINVSTGSIVVYSSEIYDIKEGNNDDSLFYSYLMGVNGMFKNKKCDD